MDKDSKPGDINEDGKEIEQDGNVTWDESLRSSDKKEEANDE